MRLNSLSKVACPKKGSKDLQRSYYRRETHMWIAFDCAIVVTCIYFKTGGGGILTINQTII